MGFLLDNMTPTTIDGQRDVVKNERARVSRTSPTQGRGRAAACALPKDHPYSWPVIGSMADLSAASHQDVMDFFKKWYGPANASLVIAGDVDTAEVKAARRSGSRTCRRASLRSRSRRVRWCCARRSGSCSRIACSCRGSTWPG
jgi:hypothetical protein